MKLYVARSHPKGSHDQRVLISTEPLIKYETIGGDHAFKSKEGAWYQYLDEGFPKGLTHKNSPKTLEA